MALDAFLELSIVIVIATLIAGFVRFLRQPLVIGYLLTGLLVSPYFLDIIKSTDTLAVFSQVGVAFLLFIVGLNLTPHVIREVGKASLITGVGQVLFTSLIGLFISRALGFSFISSLYIAIALSFSSTIIIMKLLSDKKDLGTLYGKISIGFLLVQDIIAILMLIVISSFSDGANILGVISQLIIKGAILVGIFALVGKYALPRLGNFFASSQEFLYLFSVGWGLGISALFYYLGFSMEIGALIAGVTLSLFPYCQEISSKMRILRDFFMILFFILLGAQMMFDSISSLLVPAIILSLFVLFGNPLIVMFLMGMLGHSKRTGFLAGLTVAQISEFSFIIAALGVKIGHLSNEILSLITLVGFMTIAGSTYFILYGDKIYPHIEKYLVIFEKKGARKDRIIRAGYDIFLFGYNRIGYNFLKAFQRLRKRFLVVDYDPIIISELSQKGIPNEYGDANDPEFLDSLNLKKVKMAVSTIPDLDTNLLLIDKLQRRNKKVIIIVVSHQVKDAMELYNKGASYVLMPHFLGGHYGAIMVNKHGLSLKRFLQEKEKHIKHLEARKKIGHEHPRTEFGKYR